MFLQQCIQIQNFVNYQQKFCHENSEGYEIDILILMSQLLLSLKASECERNNEKLWIGTFLSFGLKGFWGVDVALSS